MNDNPTGNVVDIIVVDDDKLNLKIAENILKENYRVASAISGEEALQLLSEYIPKLILLDIHMPGMDGKEIMAEIRKSEKLKNIPIIFLTADVEFKTQKQCMQAGAAEFIGKPFVPEILLNRVGRILELEHYHKLEAAKAQQ